MKRQLCVDVLSLSIIIIHIGTSSADRNSNAVNKVAVLLAVSVFDYNNRSCFFTNLFFTTHSHAGAGATSVVSANLNSS